MSITFLCVVHTQNKPGDPATEPLHLSLYGRHYPVPFLSALGFLSSFSVADPVGFPLVVRKG